MPRFTPAAKPPSPAPARFVVAALLLLATSAAAGSCAPSFSDETLGAGFTKAHVFSRALPDRVDHELASGGVAAGDYDGDGYIDLFVAGGDVEGNGLYRNLGDGTFEERAVEAGVSVPVGIAAGPVFVDYDGDGALDLLVPGALDAPTTLFRNLGDGTFENGTAAAGLFVGRPTIAAAFADVDRDGDLDAYLSHWATEIDEDGLVEQLYENVGGGQFVDVTQESGIGATLPRESIFPIPIDLDLTFGPSFADIDSDGWPDLLVTADFGTSHVLRNRGDGTFEDVTPGSIDDENGMGGAVGDFDNDCDLDWFVTSIWGLKGEPIQNHGISGNRLYRNDGAGGFENVTETAGVRVGDWGWGACFADFDNDGHLDLFHTNGWFSAARYLGDRSRLFLSNGDGTFSERGLELGIDDAEMGRGVACFDADRDGDIDLFVANIDGPPVFYRNAAPALHHWLGVRLDGPPGNTQGVGARVYLKTPSGTQMREILVGSRFASQDPAEAHFGLGASSRVLAVEVQWPDGAVSRVRGVPVDQQLRISHADDRLAGAAARLVRDRMGCAAPRS